MQGITRTPSGLDSLPCYQVQVENNNVKVRARRSDLKTNKRVKPMCKYDEKVKTHMVVIGGGPAGATCVETLRQEGFAGKITVVAKEKFLPYDRVKCSKAMNSDINQLQLRSEEFYKEHAIEFLKGTEAVGVDTQANKVRLGDGGVLDYTKLFVATGSWPVKAQIAGNNLKNVVVLRNYEDAQFIQSLLGPDKEVVILGASFIGMEAACYCSDKVRKVTVVGRDAVPFQRLLGPEIGQAVMNLYVEKGVQFAMNAELKECIGNAQGEVCKVKLSNGSELKADLVIMGIGSTLCTGFLKDSGIELKPNGAVEVNQYMQTNVKNVFAGGDIAYAPVFSSGNIKSNIGHYSLAHYHGRIAGINMLDKSRPVQSVPFFWTMFFGKGIRYSGGGNYDEILYVGNVNELKFAAYYLKGDVVVAMSSCGMDPIVSEFAERQAQGKVLHKRDLGSDLVAWRKK